MKQLRHIINLTFPVLLGYVSVGFVFGLVARNAGLSLGLIVCSSVFLYAGAAQFLLVRLIQVMTSLPQIFLAIFLLNLRHIFYFKPVENKMPKKGLQKIYSILALTDESFAVLTESQTKPKDSFAVLLINQSYWVFGSFVGAVFGGLIGNQIAGLDFSLVALFVVLLVEKLNWKKDKLLLIFCLIFCIATWFMLPAQYFLITAMSFACFAAWGLGEEK